MSYYCHVTLIGLRFRQVHSSFATFVVTPTQRGHTLGSLSLLDGKDPATTEATIQLSSLNKLILATIAVELVVRIVAMILEAFFTSVKITIDNSTLKVLPHPFTE